MLRLNGLTLARGGRDLLTGVTVALPVGKRYGIIGPNGIGKSTLFAAIRGELLPDKGEIDYPKSWVLAHVAQDSPNVPDSALAFALTGDVELAELYAKIPELSGEALAEAYAQLDLIDGHTAKARAAQLLVGLGFSQTELDKPVKSFSGGWRMRLQLARALMCRSDLLLLDEPTNHLDLPAMLWLETWLRRYQGLVLIITHDRDFLDQCAEGILSINDGKATLYSGNYSAYERTYAEQLTLQQAQYQSQQKKVAHLSQFITRFKAKATKAKQAQSRIKALEKMQLVDAVQAQSPFQFEFFPMESEPRQLLHLESARLGYGNTTILEGVNLEISPDSRLGLLGVNGAGKSTLVNSLAARLPLLAGERNEGKHLKIGYFAQHQIDQLDLNASALTALVRLDQSMGFATREQELRNYLGGFAFHGERVNEVIAPFSGGEKARLALALIVYQRPNLLLLDEPTNHLDIAMREALTRALQSFEGAMVLVAHDRHLLRASCDAFAVVAQGRVSVHEGDLDDYGLLLRQTDMKPEAEAPTLKVNAKEQRQQEAAERQRLANLRAPLSKKVKQVELLMAETEQTLAQLNQWFADSEAVGSAPPELLKQKSLTQIALTQRMTQAEEEWLSLQVEIESIT